MVSDYECKKRISREETRLQIVLSDYLLRGLLRHLGRIAAALLSSGDGILFDGLFILFIPCVKVAEIKLTFFRIG